MGEGHEDETGIYEFEVHPGKDPPVPSAVGYYAKLPAKLIGEAFAVADAHDVQTGIVAQPFLTLFDPASDPTLSADHCLPLSLSPFPKIMAQGPLVSRGEKDERLMFIAMNRFRIVQGRDAEFERVWAERDTHLDGVPGFMGFRLLKGPQSDDYTLYASHSTCATANPSKPGRNPRPFGKPMPGLAVSESFTWAIPSSKDLTPSSITEGYCARIKCGGFVI